MDRNIIMHVYTIIIFGTQYIDFVIEDNCVGINAPMKQRYAIPHREYLVLMLCARKMLHSYKDCIYFRQECI